MSTMLPVAVYGLEVPADDAMVPALVDFPATFRITMAAIDPSATPQMSEAHGDAPPRATLKIIREQIDDEDDDDEDDEDDDDYDSDDINAMQARLKSIIGDAEDGDDDEDEDDEDEDEAEFDANEKNGGPSDPSKTAKARRAAAAAQLMKALKEDEDEDMEDAAPNGVNGTKLNKGKAKASEDELEDDSEEDEDYGVEEFVLCTLDPSKNYQQPLDITVGEDERVYFKVTGTHNVFLTGNYVIPPEESGMYDPDDDEDDEFDYSPDEDELDDMEEDEDELDDLEDPRVTEVDSEDEEDEEEEAVPQLVKSGDKKGKNKRRAESDDEPATLDDIISKSLKPADASANGEQKLSKKQLKKLKNNAGQAVPAAVENQGANKSDATQKRTEQKPKESPNPKGDKKVQFAKNLEQGPTASPKPEEKADAKKDEQPKATLGVKTVQGVKVDDKKLGEGPAAKKGDRVGMRYIGKLEKDNKVFDSNTKGKPFYFKLGAGEVIKGWDIGVAGMSVRGERRITIPAHLAYGSKGQPGIPPNSNLVFDLKLMSIARN